MSAPKLTAEQAQLLLDPNFAVVTTIRRDGSPHSTIVWIDWDGENVVFNTTMFRAKGHNLLREPRVSIAVWDRDDAYRYLTIEGRAELDTDGADAHIEKLAQQYWGRSYQNPRERVIVRVKPERVYVYGFE
jgi:PPOX class probable F420-dependent enzyme